MAICAHCKTQETVLYDSGVPICLACANTQEAAAKQNSRFVATNGNNQAKPAGTLSEDLKRSD
jgi:hypothetical protein